MGGTRIALALGLVTLLACSACSYGGQSSDDGVPLDHAGDSGPPPDDAGPPPNDADAPDPEHTIIVGSTLDGDIERGCGAGFTAAQAAEDPRAAILAAPFFCRGYGGVWSCECDGRAEKSMAFGCEAALFEACEVAAEAIDGSGEPAKAPSMCASTQPTLAGRCSRQAGGDYECACGLTRDEPRPPIEVDIEGEGTPASCELALFRACGTPCASEYGACTGGEDAIRSYACECSTNGLSRAMLEHDCDFALNYACSPQSALDEICTGYGGYCVSTDPEEYRTMHCACADGSEHDVEHTPYWLVPRPFTCRETLEETCGLGSAPDDDQCLGDGNGHRARCTRGPDSAGPLICECYLDGDPGGYVHGGSFESESCDGALLEEICPPIAPLPEGAHEAACDHYAACERAMVGFERDTCIASVSDACAACVIGELARMPSGDDGCPEDRVRCFSPCETVVPREVHVAACRQSLEDRSELTPEASCLCDRCYPAFGECIADPGCAEILACATQQGCTLETCETDPVCGPALVPHSGTRSLALAIRLGSCEARDACRQ